jgi:hypothetical protein
MNLLCSPTCVTFWTTPSPVLTDAEAVMLNVQNMLGCEGFLDGFPVAPYGRLCGSLSRFEDGLNPRIISRRLIHRLTPRIRRLFACEADGNGRDASDMVASSALSSWVNELWLTREQCG